MFGKDANARSIDQASVGRPFRRRRWSRLPTAALTALILTAGAPALPQTQGGRPQAEDGARATIDQAYIYALPIYEIARLRYKLEFDPSREKHLQPNRLVNKRDLASAKDRLVTAPNADTLYSLAVLDLSGGPDRIDVPDMGGRYYSIQLIDAYTNVFGYIGRRTTGTKAASFLIAGPRGQPPNPDNPPVIRSPTPMAVLIIRILLYGPQDLDAAHTLQDGFKLKPLAAPLPQPEPIAPIAGSGENFVAMVNQAMAENSSAGN